jgi:transposase
LVSGVKSRLKTKAIGPRRFEVITGAGSRRRWSLDEKARIVAETLEPGVSVSDVARRHGLRPQQIFTWRRYARCASREAASPGFVPVVIDGPAALPVVRTAAPAASVPGPVPIEVRIGKAVVRVREGADPKALATILRALKRGR